LAQFRTTADILDLALSDAGETTNGTSAYESDALDYLNRVHMAIVTGGTIPIGKDSTVEIDETWPWAKSLKPLILELQPKIDTGTVTLTQGSEVGAFSSAPSVSVTGWYLRVNGREEVLRIGAHTAASTAFEIDGSYPDASGTLNFTLFKLDYTLTPEYIVIDQSNNKIEFQETAGTTLTGTLTSGVYTPTALASEVQTQMNSAGGTPAYTVTYSSVTRKFTIASDRAGGAVFVLVGTGSNSKFSAHKTLGFDDANTTNAASVVSTYVLGGLARIIEPFKINKGSGSRISGLDPEAFMRDYPLNSISEDIPNRFALLHEDEDGIITVRFNAYPRERTRVEVENTPVVRDLKDSASSIPLLPRKHVDVLVHAATFYLMYRKSDDRMQIAANLLQGKLKAMIAQHRGQLVRAGDNFGQIISRREQIPRSRKGLFNPEPF